MATIWWQRSASGCVCKLLFDSSSKRNSGLGRSSQCGGGSTVGQNFKSNAVASGGCVLLGHMCRHVGWCACADVCAV
eukprot:353394-Chlamydomonas_euryale.AAC.2